MSPNDFGSSLVQQQLRIELGEKQGYEKRVCSCQQATGV
jgi:hypothetical protein